MWKKAAMAITQEAAATTGVVYDLKGTLLEACSCNVLCPCWIGEDPDRGTCQAVIAWHFDEGTIKGVDVAGRTLAGAVFIPGNILQGNWKVALYVDDGATEEQMESILDAYTGKLGGPLADLAQLIGEVLTVEKAPIRHELKGVAGTLRIGDFASADMSPYTSADGTVTTLHNSIFSTVPGSPAYVGKTGHYEVKLPQFGFEWSYDGSNAIQSDYHMVYAGE
jgi:hypothetical protein